jgi:hypothetical protein
MTTNWADVMQELRAYPPGVNTIRLPCPRSRIANTELQLGKLPRELVRMLEQFNGAILFKSGAGSWLVTLFGLSEDQPLPPFEWGEDWWIDKFTPLWRKAGGRSRQNEWAFAIMSYGELILLDREGMIRKWDTAQAQWDPSPPISFDEWLQEVLREGKTYLNEK